MRSRSGAALIDGEIRTGTGAEWETTGLRGVSSTGGIGADGRFEAAGTSAAGAWTVLTDGTLAG